MFTRKDPNANESFNGVLWSIIPKETFVELLTLKFGAFLAVLQFNDGSKGILSVLEYLHIPMGYFILKGFSRLMTKELSTRRDIHCQLQKTREKTQRTFALSEKKEGVTYKCGEF
ncbi:uncharacterized protein TNCV_3446141 [Trichonephila clavipes]|nr:uncharacterized protein TNCV_3446141 [Trichonephila clavipes]